MFAIRSISQVDNAVKEADPRIFGHRVAFKLSSIVDFKCSLSLSLSPSLSANLVVLLLVCFLVKFANLPDTRLATRRTVIAALSVQRQQLERLRRSLQSSARSADCGGSHQADLALKDSF